MTPTPSQDPPIPQGGGGLMLWPWPWQGGWGGDPEPGTYIYVCYIVLWKTLLQPNKGSERIRTVCMYMSVALHLLQSLSISVLSCLAASPPKNALPGRNKVAGAKDWNQLKVVRAFFFWAWMPLTLYTLSCMYINIYTYIHIHKYIYIYIQTVCIIPRVCDIQIHMIHNNEVESAYEGVQWLFLIKCY